MPLKDFTLLLIRLFLGFVFFSSGLCKLADGNFGQLIGPPDLINQLAEYKLGLFGYFIAASQVVFGALVMSQRFSLVGLIALVPMNLSILGVTVSMGWQGTPYVNGFLLLLNLIALLYEFRSLKVLISDQPSTNSIPHSIAFFPKLGLPLAAVGFTFLAMFFASGGGFLLNSLATVALLAILFNLRQYSNYSLIDKAILLLFGLSVLFMVYIKAVYEIWSRAGIVLVALVLIALVLYMIKLIRLALKLYRPQKSRLAD